MRVFNFAKRNFKEIIRDPLSVVFAILLPLVILFVFQQINIPNDSYKIENFTSGILIFGFSFISLFTAMLISKDRTSSLLIRMAVSPMKPFEYILGYMFSIIPLIFIQNICFFTLAIILGLSFSFYLILAVFVSLFISIIFIALGIIIGSLFSEKASSGISSIVVQLVSFTSGMYFPKELLGNVFAKICEYLPFESCVVILKAVMNNQFDLISSRNILVILFYTIIILVISIALFKKKMKSDQR